MLIEMFLKGPDVEKKKKSKKAKKRRKLVKIVEGDDDFGMDVDDGCEDMALSSNL